MSDTYQILGLVVFDRSDDGCDGTDAARSGSGRSVDCLIVKLLGRTVFVDQCCGCVCVGGVF